MAWALWGSRSDLFKLYLNETIKYLKILKYFRNISIGIFFNIENTFNFNIITLNFHIVILNF